MSYKDILGKIYDSGKAKPIDKVKPLPPVLTLSPSVNWAIGGGVVPGRTYCIEGPPSGGKTMYTMGICASLLRQDDDGVIVWYDAELSPPDHWKDVFMPEIDPMRVMVISKNYCTDIFDHFYNDVVADLIEEKGLKVVGMVIDSLQSIVPPKEASRESTDKALYAALAGYLPGALRQILEPIRRHNIPLIVISQVRANMDPSAAYTHEKWVASGGLAWKHAIDTEMEFSIIEGKDSRIVDENMTNFNDSSLVTGHKVRMKVKKNKLGASYRVAEFTLDFQKGIVRLGEEIAQLGINLGVINKEGNTYYFDGQKLAVGEEKTINLIDSSPAIQEAILRSIEGK